MVRQSCSDPFPGPQINWDILRLLEDILAWPISFSSMYSPQNAASPHTLSKARCLWVVLNPSVSLLPTPNQSQVLLILHLNIFHTYLLPFNPFTIPVNLLLGWLWFTPVICTCSTLSLFPSCQRHLPQNTLDHATPYLKPIPGSSLPSDNAQAPQLVLTDPAGSTSSLLIDPTFHWAPPTVPVSRW